MAQEAPDRIILVGDHTDGMREKVWEVCKEQSIPLTFVSTEVIASLERLRIHDLLGISLVTRHQYKVDWVDATLKRSLDLIVASIVLMMLSPIIPLIALAIKLDSRGPILFKQLRSLSDQGKPFEFYKFRTMRAGADEEKDELGHLNESDGALFKMSDDPRITRMGEVLRRYSLDELPQLVNVLKGDMSLVGPRPLPVKDYEKTQGYDPIWRRRELGVPGITGLWQINGRSDLSFEEMVLLDLYYIEKRSVLFDIEILLDTIPAVLLGRGAY